MSQSPQLSAYYQYLLSDPSLQSILSLAGCVSDPGRALVHGILEPLNSLRRLGRLTGQTCIILVDGLCEAEIHRYYIGHIHMKKLVIKTIVDENKSVKFPLFTYTIKFTFFK